MESKSYQNHDCAMVTVHLYTLLNSVSTLEIVRSSMKTFELERACNGCLGMGKEKNFFIKVNEI